MYVCRDLANPIPLTEVNMQLRDFHDPDEVVCSNIDGEYIHN